MRASGGTNFGLAESVVALTNSTIACLAGPSFHEDNGSHHAFRVSPSTDRRDTVHTSARFLIEPPWFRVLPPGSSMQEPEGCRSCPVLPAGAAAGPRDPPRPGRPGC